MVSQTSRSAMDEGCDKAIRYRHYCLSLPSTHCKNFLATERGILSKIRGRTPGIRISMYADDAALFLAPRQNEVSALAELLTFFGEATRLKTNFHKSTVVPIHCAVLNMATILGQLPTKQSHFPIKYLGLPLTTTRLRRSDFQPLVDKTVAKLNGWNGRNLSHAGRLTLV